MAKRKVYHVVHDKEEGVWKGKVEGASRASVTAPTKRRQLRQFVPSLGKRLSVR